MHKNASPACLAHTLQALPLCCTAWPASTPSTWPTTSDPPLARARTCRQRRLRSRSRAARLRWGRATPACQLPGGGPPLTCPPQSHWQVGGPRASSMQGKDGVFLGQWVKGTSCASIQHATLPFRLLARCWRLCNHHLLQSSALTEDSGVARALHRELSPAGRPAQCPLHALLLLGL
jgi:hypothetical protein